MCNLPDLLKNIGLSDKEAAIYLVSLKLGSNPASIIAKNAEINRCTTYSILESLTKKGLVTEIEKENIKYFTALPPQQLIIYIDEKRRGLAYYKDKILSYLPEFRTIQNQEYVQSSIQSYTGKNGLTQIYSSAIQEDSLTVWAVPSKEKHEFFVRFAPEYLRTHKSLKIIKYSNNQASKYEIKTNDDLNNLKSIQPVEFITKNKVFLASESDPYGVEIVNPEIVKYFKNKFELYWKNKKALSI